MSGMSENPHPPPPSSGGKRGVAAPQRDSLPERLIAVGCLLLVIPCLLATVAAIFYGWPYVVYGLR
jgi:hypothetical protein